MNTCQNDKSQTGEALLDLRRRTEYGKIRCEQEGMPLETGRICCFTGHRPGKLPWKENEWDRRCIALKERIMVLLREAYRQGCRHFITGMARGIDTYCCEAVLRLRREWDDVVLEAAIPCQTQAQGWKARDQERYRRLLAQCDLQTLIQPDYTPGCMLRRDRYMVQRADYVIGVYDGVSQGGTRQTLAYALGQKREVCVIHLDDFLK